MARGIADTVATQGVFRRVRGRGCQVAKAGMEGAGRQTRRNTAGYSPKYMTSKSMEKENSEISRPLIIRSCKVMLTTWLALR